MKQFSVTLSRNVIAGIALLLATAGLQLAQAAGYTWDGDSDGSWSTGANWNPDGTPANANTSTLTFSSTSGIGTTLNTGTFNAIGTLTFDASTLAYTIDQGVGGTLTLSGGIQQLGAQTITFNNGMTLSGATTMNVSQASGGLTLGGILRGAGSLTMTGSGMLTLSGVNTYTGATVLQGGILRATTSASALGAGALTLSGGELQLANASGTGLNFARATTVNGTATITSDLTSGTVGNTYTLTTLAIGAQTLTIAGGANVSSGTAGITFSGATTASTGASIFKINNPSAGGTTLLTLGGTIATGTQTLTLQGNGNFTQTGIWSAASATASTVILALDSTYSGIATLSGANTFVGVISLNSSSATLVGTVAAAFGATSSTLKFNNASGSAVELRNDTATNFTTGLDSTSAGGTITVNRASGAATATTHTLTLPNRLGSSTITVQAGGSITSGTAYGLTLSGTSTLSGNATFVINGNGSGVGTLSLTGGFNTGGTTRTVTFNGDTSAVVISGAFSGTAGILDLAGTTPKVTVNALTTTANALQLSGSGTYTLAGASTYTGGVILNNSAATVIATAAGGFGATSGKVKFNVAGTGFTLQNDTATSFTTGLDSTLYGGTITVNRATGAATATTHTLTLANTLGGTTITIQAGGSITSGTAYGLTLSGTSTLSGNATFVINNNGAGAGLLTVGTITGGANSLTLKGAGNFAQTALWAGSGSSLILDATYTGAATLNQANTFTGGVTLGGGKLNINLAGTAGASGPLGNGGTLNINGGTIDNTSTAAKVLLNVNPITIGGNFAFSTSAGTAANNLTLPGAVSMAADRTITLNGAGILTLSGKLTNTGDSVRTLTVNNGAGTTTATALSLGSYALTGAGSTAARNNVINGTGNMTITGVVSDGVSAGSGLTYSGSGILTLTGANTYTGITTISAGILSVGTLANGGAACGLGQSGSLASSLIIDGGALRYTGVATSMNRSFTIGATGTLDASGAGGITWNNTGAIAFVAPATSVRTFNLAGTGSGTLAAVIGDSGSATSLAKSGAGTWYLTGVNTYTGGTTLNTGGLTLGNANAVGTGTFTINGGTLTLGSFTMANNFVANGNFSVAGGTGIYPNTGTGTFKISQPIAINGGSDNQTGVGFTFGNVITDISGGNTLNAFDITWSVTGSTAEITLSGNITLRDNQTLTANVASGDGFAITGNILEGTTPGYGLTITGTMTQPSGSVGGGGRGNYIMLAGANTYTGNTTITPGAVLVLGNKGGSTTGSLNPTGTVVDNGVFAFNRSNNIAQGTDFGTITGSGSIIQSAAGTTVLTNVNTYTGVTIIAGGVLSIGSIANAGTTSPLGAYATPGAGGITLSGGALQYTGGNASTDRGFTVAANSTIDVNTAGASLTMGASSIGAFTLTVTGGTGSVLNLPTITFTGATGGLTVNTPASLQVGPTITTPTNLGLTLGGTGIGTISASFNLGTATLTKSGTGTWYLNGSTTAGNLYIGYNTGNNNSYGSVIIGSGGTLSVGYGSSNNLFIGWGSGSSNNGYGTLDASGAASVIINVAKVEIGGTCGGTGILNLGTNNVITATTDFAIEKGSWGSPAGYGTVTTPASSTTTIHTPNMYVAYNTPNGTTLGSGTFTLGSGATLALDGISGGRTALVIGYATGNGGYSSTTVGTMDLSAGVASLKLSSLVVGYKTTTSTGTGILTLSSNAANHIDISGASISANAPGVVVIGSVNGATANGTVTIGNLDATSAITSTDNGTAILLAYKPSTGTTTGTLNFMAGTLAITTTGAAISGGGGTSVLNLGTTTGSGVTLIAGTSSTNWIQNLTTATFSGPVTINDGGNNITIPQVFSGSGSLTKDGSGALTLSGANTYSGATVVNGGKLVIGATGAINSTSGISIGVGEFMYNNSTTALTVAPTFSGTGGVLSGTGVITPAVTITSGNILSPGNNVGTLTFNGGLSLDTGAIVRITNAGSVLAQVNNDYTDSLGAHSLVVVGEPSLATPYLFLQWTGSSGSLPDGVQSNWSLGVPSESSTAQWVGTALSDTWTMTSSWLIVTGYTGSVTADITAKTLSFTLTSLSGSNGLPQVYHDVFINPSTSGITITGPSSAVTINSLQVGGANNSSPTLNLGSGTITVISEVNVRGNGVLNATTGALIAPTLNIISANASATLGNAFDNITTANISGGTFTVNAGSVATVNLSGTGLLTGSQAVPQVNVTGGTPAFSGNTTTMNVMGGAVSAIGGTISTLTLPAGSTGTFNVGLGLQVGTGNFSASAGTVNALNELTVTSKLLLGSTVTITAGTTPFKVAGSNVVNPVGTTLVLQGGTTTINQTASGTLSAVNLPSTDVSLTANSFLNLGYAGYATLGNLNMSGSTVTFQTATGVNLSGITATGTSLIPSGTPISIRGGDVSVGTSATLTIGAVIGNQGTVTTPSFTKTGDGTLILLGNNTYTGGTTLDAGILNVGTANALGSSTGTLTVNGGTLDLNGNSITVGPLGGGGGVITDTSSGSGTTTLTANQSGGVTLASNIKDGATKTLAFTKGGTGYLELSGNNAYSGLTTINSGDLAVSGGSAIPDTGRVVLSAVNAAVLRLNTSETIGSLEGGTDTLPNGVDLNGNTLTTGANNANTTFAGLLVDGAGGGTITKTGTGTWTLTGNSTGYGTWAMDVAQGTVVAGNDNALGSGQVTLSGGALVLSGGVTLANPVDLSSSGTIGSSGSGALSGMITGGTALTKTGAGDLTLSGNNSYSGNTIIDSGTLVVSNGNAIPDTSRVVLSTANAAILLLNTSETIGSLEGGTTTVTNGVELAGNTLTTGGNNADTTFAGILADAVGGGTITKTGTGTWTLIGDSTGFTWTMDVAAGKVINNGTFDPSTTVNVTGGTLGGTGTVGAVTLSPTGYLSPGNSPGVMTMASLDLSGGVTNGALQFELDTPATSDRIDVAGALNIGSGLLGFTNFQFTALGGLTNDVYTLITSVTLTGALNPGDLSGLVGVDRIGTLSITGNDLFLTLAAIPEPSTWVLVGIALLPLFFRRSRKS